jgi:hypothetical protein
MKKTVDQLLLLSREWQLAIDSMLHSAVEQEMDPTTKDALFVSGADAVNALRSIEEQIHIALGYSYTRSTYDPTISFEKRVGLPQIEHAGDVKEYYIERMNEILDAITDEIANDSYLGDAAHANQRFEKNPTHTSKEGDFQTAISDIISTLEADVVDNS